jgi:hypothetical protein
MHIILGVLGAIVTILVLMNRLSDVGVDIGWLDPFKWQRRRKWKQKYNTDPAFLFDDPMEATAGLMYTMIKLSGDITLEEKEFLLSTFQNEFQLSTSEASTLLSTCSFQIKDEILVRDNLTKYLERSLKAFTPVQKESACSLIEKTAAFGNNPNDIQTAFLSNIRAILLPEPNNNTWKG